MNHVSLINGHNLLCIQPPRMLVPLSMFKAPVWSGSLWGSQWDSFPVLVMSEDSSPSTVHCPLWSPALCSERTLSHKHGRSAAQHGLSVLVAGVARLTEASGPPDRQQNEKYFLAIQLCSLWALLLWRPLLEQQLERLYSISPNYHMEGEWTKWFQNCLGREGCFVIFSGKI